MYHITIAIANVIYLEKQCKGKVAAGPQMNNFVEKGISISAQSMKIVPALPHFNRQIMTS